MTTVTIPFQDTTIRGIELKSFHGKEYQAFLGIPYAKPPINELRFIPPQPIQNYTEEIDATKSKNPPLQISQRTEELIGDEDCLNLNIYIPELPSHNLKAVIFYIYGDLFANGTPDDYQPDLLIENDIVFVTFNYRLGVLGFLNLDLPECPGNVGLKDTLCALKWVKQNIEYFGGDSENITVQGCGFGSSMAHLLIMSPLCKNLIKQAILESGDALTGFNEVQTPTESAFQLGQILGYKGDNKIELLNFLKHLPAIELFNGVKKLDCKDHLKIIPNYFLPSVESIEKDALLPDTPENLWKTADQIPLIQLMCETSTQISYSAVCLVENQIQYYFQTETEKFDDLKEDVVKFYFHDLALQHCYTTFNFMITNLSPTYVCKFTYVGNCNIGRNYLYNKLVFKQDPESVYGDNVWYNFIKENYNPNEKDLKVAHYICNLWANFAKYGNPNGKEFENLWRPISSKNPSYLEIDEELKSISEYPNNEGAIFWKYLYEKYSLEKKNSN